jgi:Na+/glutamate symporter
VSTQVTNGVPRKQPANVYTVMLILSVVFLLIAVIAMIIEYRRYAPDYWKTGTARPVGASVQSVSEMVLQMQRLG